MQESIFISPNLSIKEALKKLNETSKKVLLVVDKNKKLLGTITDGDIRRHFIRKGKLDGKVKDIYNKNPIKVSENYPKEKIKEIFLEKKVELIPVVNNQGKVINYLIWNEFFKDKPQKTYEKIDIPVVIMAGGKGTRLSPFTEIIPKPLIPIKNKTMIEHIIDNFKKFGVKKFYITVNYKGKLIETYFSTIEKDYEVNFIWEKEFLGTAGSLKYLEKQIESTFIVSNCDILVKANYSNVLKFHKKNNAVFTSITSIQNYKIPYGVVETTKGGEILKIKEKPEFIFQINTGVYILNKEVLKYIPKDTYFDMPNLINTLLSKKEKVLAYPVNNDKYIDMGQWDEYKKAVEKIESIIQ